MPNEEYLRDDMCEGINMAYDVKYVRLSLNTSWALASCSHVHLCTIPKVLAEIRKKNVCQSRIT